MTQITQERRGRGRPQVRPDAETRALIIEAARQEFEANGYAATNICTVAQRASVSTKTLYRLVPTKADLFRAVVSERISRFLLEVDPVALDKVELAQALERMLTSYGELTLDPGTVLINRLVIGESGSFPELATSFYEVAINRTSEAMAGWLARQCERGLIALDDPYLAAGMLRGMMIMEPQRSILLGKRPAPDPDEIAARAKVCAKLFLDGCRRS